MTLAEDTTTFLAADGWVVTQRDQMLIVGTRQGYGPVSDQMLIWVPQRGYAPEQLRMREDGYLRRFEEQARTPGQKYLLTESTEGFSAEFRRRAFREFGVTLTVPTDFFDAPFKWDRGPAGTAASSLRNRGRDAAADRIAQPFTSSRAYASQEDLLRVLLSEFKPFQNGPPVHLVVAPAGFGKSHLFRCLFAQLYGDFITAKSEERRALRPLPLLPEHLASATAPTLKALVEAFLTTEVARPLRLESFEWMLTRGYACFLLDGLDEVIERDRFFFDYLYELLTRPDVPHPPKILICVRDSLLVSNKGLGDFLEDAGPDLVARHHLAQWKRPSIGTYTGRNLDRAQAWALMELLDSNPNLMKLAGTPFYCEALTSEVGHGLDPSALDTATTETALLELAVHRMIDREFDKGLLQRSWVTVGEIESFVKDIAEENLDGGGKGLPVEDVASFAPYSLSSDLDETEMEEAVRQIQQLPFFTGAIDLGRLSFSQDVVYDYLLGMRATEYLASNPRRFLHLLGVQTFSPGSATLHVICEHVQKTGTLDDLFQTALDAAQDRIAFRNTLQIILSLEDTEWIVRRLPLERQDLSGLRFTNMNLRDVSFRGANLEGAAFQRCTMSGAVLAEAVVKGTAFEDCEGVSAADFGDLSTFFSAKVGAQAFEEPAEFLLAIGARTGQEAKRYVRPCAAASQLRFLFGKYVYADGSARRNWLDEKGAIAGRRFVDPKTVLDAARRHGFLEWDQARRRYTRTRGDQYSDMIGLVSKLQVTPRLRVLLADVCAEPGCNHVLELESAEA
jgi:pentapeptide repeat protein